MGLAGLKTKRGSWVKAGRTGGPYLPGSYRDYTYVRSPPSPYAKTPQQKKIGAVGKCVRSDCAGKSGPGFFDCRDACIKKGGF